MSRNQTQFNFHHLDIDETFKERIRDAAAAKGVTIGEFCLSALRDAVAAKKRTNGAAGRVIGKTPDGIPLVYTGHRPALAMSPAEKAARKRRKDLEQKRRKRDERFAAMARWAAMGEEAADGAD